MYSFPFVFFSIIPVKISVQKWYVNHVKVFSSNSLISWSSLVEGGEGWIGPSKKLLCLRLTRKNYAIHAWHNSKVVWLLGRSVAHLLLLKSSMLIYISKRVHFPLLLFVTASKPSSSAVWPDWAILQVFGDIFLR